MCGRTQRTDVWTYMVDGRAGRTRRTNVHSGPTYTADGRAGVRQWRICGVRGQAPGGINVGEGTRNRMFSERAREMRQPKTLLCLIPSLQLFPFPCHDTYHMTFYSFFSTLFHQQPLLTTCRTYRNTHRIGIHSLPRHLPLPVPFTTELAYESESGVTVGLELFVQGIGAQCTLNSPVDGHNHHRYPKHHSSKASTSLFAASLNRCPGWGR